MSSNSKIEWTDATWTPIKARRKDTGKVGWHCEKVSDGCKHCYSETFNSRMLPNGGTGLDYTRQSRDKVDIFVDDKTLTQPLRWKKPRRVFVCSMTDLFGEFVPFDFIDRVFAVMALCPQHTFQVLTKRPERMAEYLTEFYREGGQLEAMNEDGWSPIWHGRYTPETFHRLAELDVLPNVMLGTSVENQQQADARIPHLLRCPAAVRFLSVEPLLAPVDLDPTGCDICESSENVEHHNGSDVPWCNDCDHEAGSFRGWLDPGGIDLVICGGESGPGARPCNVGGIRSILQQCRADGVAKFVKQVGAKPYEMADNGPAVRSWGDAEIRINGEYVQIHLRDRKGGDMSEWPQDLQVREMPVIGGGA